jgi:hypothetical protein
LPDTPVRERNSAAETLKGSASSAYACMENATG